MRDEERAERLTRAIEEMLQGHMPEGLDDEELNDLLEIAKVRLDAADLAASAGEAVQHEVLKRLIARLESHQRNRTDDPSSTAPDDSADPATTDRPKDVNVRDLQEVIELRRRIAKHVASISEGRREAVWQRVQGRIQAERSQKRGLSFWPFHRRHREAEDLGVALDRLVLGEPIWEAEGSPLEDMLRVAHARKAAGEAATTNLGDQQARVWARVRSRLLAGVKPPRRASVSEPQTAARHGPKLAVAGAMAALVLALLGPFAASGLSGHPVADAVRFVGRHVGVVETSSAPVVPEPTEVVQGQEISVAAASEQLGLSAHSPAYVPEGYSHASSRYFDTPITADEGGVFVLAYEGPTADDTILVFQERASSTGIAVEEGFAQDIRLSDGTLATVVTGTWRTVNSGLVWGSEGAQTLVFNLGSLRVTIHAKSAFLPLSELAAMADSLAEQAAATE